MFTTLFLLALLLVIMSVIYGSVFFKGNFKVTKSVKEYFWGTDDDY